jgi:hypothetical protein
MKTDRSIIWKLLRYERLLIRTWPEMMAERRREQRGTRVNVEGIRAAPLLLFIAPSLANGFLLTPGC